MSKRVVAILSQYPSLVAIHNESMSEAKELAGEFEALEKRVLAGKKVYWEKMEAEMKNQGIFPQDADFSKIHVQVVEAADAIYVVDKEKSDIPKVLSDLFARMREGGAKIEIDEECEVCKDETK